MRYLPAVGSLLSLLMLLVSTSASASELASLVPGHWLEVRGQLDERGVFQAQRVELIEPQKKEEIVGTLHASQSREDEYRLLGQRVQLSRKTRYRNINSQDVPDAWVKVTGYYRGPRRFSVRSVSARNPGPQKITGQLSRILPAPGGSMLTIMNFRVFVPDAVELWSEQPFRTYAIAPPQLIPLRDGEYSEEDQFGEGFQLAKRLWLSTNLESRFKSEDDYNLDRQNDEDRHDLIFRGRARLSMDPTAFGVSGQLEYRYSYLRRDDGSEPGGSFGETENRLGESFIFINNLFDTDFDIQAGRMDFDDRREWLYDQDLDGLRVYWSFAGLTTELSATTTLSDGSPKDQSTDNYILYLTDRERNYAAYAIHRDTEEPYEQQITHYGLRAFVNWPRKHESWLELSAIDGRRDDQNGRSELGGWGFDIGSTRKLSKRWFLTGAWAFGSGDGDVKDGSDNNFRQTGLQDNNAKFAGVTSFRYYGELVDPELSNLHIGTLGLGYNFTRKSSLDLVTHYYRQDEAARKLVDADLDGRSKSRSRELGWEVDAVWGWRPEPAWDFEVVLGWFGPGKAFEKADDAWMSQAQVRYRF